MTLACGHDAPPYGPPLCEHLRTATESAYHVHYTGDGLSNRYVCESCRDTGGADARHLCEDCVDAALGEVQGVTGAPGVTERPEPLDVTVDSRPLPADTGPVIDLAATARGPLLLGEDGRLLLWDPRGGGCTEVARSSVVPAAGAEPWCGRVQTRRLHASADGRFAAVVIDYGRRGEILDLTTGSVTRAPENDGYHSDTVPYSLAFTVHDGRTVALYRSAWNRITACDPATGRTLTEIPMDGEDSPWKSLFHGRLLPSPTGTRVASDGWLWHPWGSVAVWNLAAWLAEGVAAWPDAVDWTLVGGCDYYWDRPVVWLDDHRLAVGGIGDDEELLVNGATVYAFTGGSGTRPEATVFAGPHGRFHAAGGLLFSDGEDGMDVWDPVDGARLGTVPGFRPTHQDHAAGELLQLDAEAGVVRAWSVARAGVKSA
ncbi:hypothetical protein [Streptomyces sp. NPDC096068]|uniref:hypothetical protein n=1 Tax=Streptomyces sp. NPDC096068 TaxID=3155424 RepID=UPI003329A4FD